MSNKVILNTDKAPIAIGPYNQSIKAGKTLYLSGQIPLIPETMAVVDTGIEDETHQVLNNIKAVLENANYTLEDVVKVTIYIDNMNDFATINEIYAQYFTDNQPARECIAVKTLPKNVHVEISVIAWKD